MRVDNKQLLLLLYKGKITRDKFIKKYLNGKPFTAEVVVNLLSNAIENKDELQLAIANILLIDPPDFSVKDFTNLLCNLLLADWHTGHEDIAMLLRNGSDPLAINCLYSAAEKIYNYLEYDDTYQFARKCIKALSSIDDIEAIEKLSLLADSKNPIIGAYAKKELLHKSN